MARPLRAEYPWTLDPVAARGNRRGRIYLDEADHRRFVETLAQAVQWFNWVLSAYCLMGHHYHVLVARSDPMGCVSQCLPGSATKGLTISTPANRRPACMSSENRTAQSAWIAI